MWRSSLSAVASEVLFVFKSSMVMVDGGSSEALPWCDWKTVGFVLPKCIGIKHMVLAKEKCLLKRICGLVFQINRHNALNMVVKIPEILVYFLRIKNYRLL
uniref:Uncharacterized protein n=1 Tax=Candidatus Kentrum sp. FW TaxID=2126338 RepID=A0A450SXP3_9GAMM|nr:MAG: hypothetical protein BECKFW1821B_GA0114236_104327 [Candidatus Kentron sp. FW]